MRNPEPKLVPIEKKKQISGEEKKLKESVIGMREKVRSSNGEKRVRAKNEK